MELEEEELRSRCGERRAVRVWKRDGGKNLMDLADASLNLESNGLHQVTAAEAAALLLAGETLETARALFRLAWPWEVAA